jgi:hypothetical protein
MDVNTKKERKNLNACMRVHVKASHPIEEKAARTSYAKIINGKP